MYCHVFNDLLSMSCVFCSRDWYTYTKCINLEKSYFSICTHLPPQPQHHSLHTHAQVGRIKSPLKWFPSSSSPSPRQCSQPYQFSRICCVMLHLPLLVHTQLLSVITRCKHIFKGDIAQRAIRRTGTCVCVCVWPECATRHATGPHKCSTPDRLVGVVHLTSLYTAARIGRAWTSGANKKPLFSIVATHHFCRAVRSCFCVCRMFGVCHDGVCGKLPAIDDGRMWRTQTAPHVYAVRVRRVRKRMSH